MSDSISKLIYARLASTFSNRVYPETAPNGTLTYPLCVYEINSTNYVSTTTGNTATSRPRVSFIIAAETRAALMSVKDTFFGLIDKQQYTAGGIQCTGSFIDNDSIDFDQITEARKQLFLFNCEAEFFIKDP